MERDAELTTTPLSLTLCGLGIRWSEICELPHLVIKKRSEIMNKTLKEILKALAPPKDWWIIILIFDRRKQWQVLAFLDFL